MPNYKLSPSHNCITEQTSQAISLEEEFIVKFWGVRGLIPRPSCKSCRYGGNTACVEMFLAGKRLIFDGGTGLHTLGKSWLKQHGSLEAHLFFTNSQSNRIQGFPFFAPAFIPENCLHIYGIAASNGASIKQCLCDQMLQPHFPYPLQLMQCELQFHNLTPNWVVKLDNVSITTALINSTHKSIGYRISWQEYNIAYVTDLQKLSTESERRCIAELTEGVDLLITNANYTLGPPRNDRETDLHWQTAVDLADTARVKQLVISQHHPDDDDDFLDQVQTDVKSAFAEALLAREGLTFSIV